ncbi:MAG: ABC transporter permease subunit [Minicystis sp.]
MIDPGRARALLGALRRDRAAACAALVLAILVAACVLVPSLSSLRWDETRLDLGATPPSAAHWLGTDAFGRDLLVRVLLGGRVTLAVGLSASLLSFAVGLAWGTAAAWIGGRVDAVMMRVVDVVDALPVMAIVLLVQAFFAGEGSTPLRLFRRALAALGQRPDAPWTLPIFQLVFVSLLLGALSWTTLARVARGQGLVLRGQPFIEAARALGARPAAIVIRHLIPNLLGPAVVVVAVGLPDVMTAEAFLSFLGVGAQEPLASLGLLVAAGAEGMDVRPWLLAAPVVLLLAILVCSNLLAERLREGLGIRGRAARRRR